MNRRLVGANARMIGLLAVLLALLGVAAYVWYNKLKDEGVIEEPHDAEQITVKYENMPGVGVTQYNYNWSPVQSGTHVSSNLQLTFSNQTKYEVSGIKVRLDIYGTTDEKPVYSESQWLGGFTDGRTNLRDAMFPFSTCRSQGVYLIPQVAFAALQSNGRWEFKLEEVIYFDNPKDLTKPNHLFSLIARNDFQAYKREVERDPKLLEVRTDGSNMSAEYVAAAYNNTDALAYLWSKGVEAHKGRTQSVEPLMVAAYNGSIQAMNFLIGRKVDLNAQEQLGGSALHYAVRTSQLQAVQTLVAAGAKVDIQEGEGKTPLMFAATAGALDIVRFLLDSGADINKADKVGRSPIHSATFSKNIDVVKELVKRKARLTGVDQEGYSVLHYAAAGGYVEITKYLASLKIDKRLKDKQGRTAQDIAFDAGNDNLATFLRP